jgi:glycosyltransferase involved in cell wall biosynthesis
MVCEVPILACAAAAVPETLGAAGVMVEPSAPVEEIAALALLLASDVALRERVLDAQRRRREAFVPNALDRVIRRFAVELTRR